MKLKQGLQKWANEWRSLRTWGRSLDEIAVTVRQRHKGDYSTGIAYPMQRRIIITAPDMVTGLSVLLHELAHVAVPGDEKHGARWRECFVGAVREVTSIAVAPVGNVQLIDDAVEAAIGQWWKLSGNEFAWKLIADPR